MSPLDKINPALSRRHFLIGASLTASGLLIGVRPSLAADAPPLPLQPNAFIRIPAEGKIALIMPSVEMGQGIYTAVAMLLAYGSVGATAAPADDKLPDISEIMKKGHDKTEGYIAKIREATKGEKWEDAQKYAKTLAFFGESLGKNKPQKGDEKSWKALTDKYAANTKAVYKATQDKDAKGVTKGLGGINCMECHKAHK